MVSQAFKLRPAHLYLFVSVHYGIVSVQNKHILTLCENRIILLYFNLLDVLARIMIKAIQIIVQNKIKI